MGEEEEEGGRRGRGYDGAFLSLRFLTDEAGKSLGHCRLRGDSRRGRAVDAGRRSTGPRPSLVLVLVGLGAAHP